MKLVYAVLLILVVTDFVSAKEDKKTSDSSPYYCVDADAKTAKISKATAADIEGLCKGKIRDDLSACLEKAKSSHCRTIAGGTFYGKLSEIPNKTTCTEFTNKFLGARGLGSLKKPGSTVRTSMPTTQSDSGQPNFHFDITNPEKGSDFSSGNVISASSTVNKSTHEETWALTVESNSRVPLFEQRKEFGTNDDGQPGAYKRVYEFSVVNDVCVLNSITMKFQPKAPKGEEGYPRYKAQERELKRQDCDHTAQVFRGENYSRQFGKTPAGDLLETWICNESVTAFNQPERAATNGTRPGRGHHEKAGRDAERAR